MKKTLLVTAAVLVAMMCCSRAFAAGTASNWNVKLTFSTDSTADVYPLVIGEGQAADELLKPPPLPGSSVTGNVSDAVINAYVVSASAARQAAKSIGVPDTAVPGRVWPVEVQVEQAGATVSLDVDFTEFYDGYTFTAINPETGEFKVFSRSNSKQAVMTAATAGTKTLYIMAGKSASFAVATPTNTFGAVRIAGMGMKPGINVYKDGSQIATTNESGTFNAAALSLGTHKIRVDAPRFVGMEMTINVTASGSNIVLPDIYPGDINDNGMINLNDLTMMKSTFNKTSTQEGYNALCDINGDNVVNLSDLALMKYGFNKIESWYGH
ncbi:MAG: dockerin type I domain-containing protein [bacterium]